jgi:hypothetical protein
VRSCLDNAWRQATKNPDAPTLQGETFREHEPSSSWENKVQIIISIICFVRRAWIFDDESIELRSRLLLVVWFLVASAHLWNRPFLLQLVVVVSPFWVCLFWLLDRGYMPLWKITWKKRRVSFAHRLVSYELVSTTHSVSLCFLIGFRSFGERDSH